VPTNNYNLLFREACGVSRTGENLETGNSTAGTRVQGRKIGLLWAAGGNGKEKSA